MKKRMRLTFYMVFLMCVLQAQTTIRLQNPSFEWDNVQPGKVPSGWTDLGMEGESPPDILPGPWEVKLEAAHGTTYLGLVVRDNNTWEGIGQTLKGRITKDSAYTFSVDLAYCDTFLSFSRINFREDVYYDTPTVLRIWGINSIFNRKELLAESTVIDHTDWIRYAFTLKPTKADCDVLQLMAYYAPGKEKMNGNLLVDNCSDIELKK